MKVILLQNVPGLGKMEDVKEVADGYARNFLFPRHLAVAASAGALSDLEAQKKKRTKDEIRDLQIQQTLADKLGSMALEMKEKANEQGFLYAAVGAQKISEALLKKGIEVDKNQIAVEPIKEAGEFEATVKLRHGLEAKLTVLVSV